MSLILWCRYRRQGLRKAWQFSEMTSFSVQVVSVLLALLIAYAFVAWIDQSIGDAERIGRVERKDGAA